jgi:Tol biopolymer transport system component
MNRPAYSGSLYWAVLYLPFACFAQADNVEDYAKECYRLLDIDKPAMEMAFGGTNRACYYGTPLTTKHNGIALDPTNLVPGKKNFLKTCDAPAWLPSTGPSQCYGATYIKTLSFTNHPTVQGALLCRHKTRDPALDPSGQPTHKDFDDIAMILHDQKTGRTCWFQAPDDGRLLDGEHVPAPHLDAPPSGVPRASDFWLKPSETAGIQCAQCHDNGPWMNSQWLYSQHKELTDDGPGKYETVKYGSMFDSWPKTDDFVEIGRTGLEGEAHLTPAERDIQRKLPECTSCHKLSAAKSNGTAWSPGLLGSDSNGTYFRWFAYSTGRATIPKSTATEHSPRLPGDYLFTHWMPPGAKRPPDADTYNKLYKTHLETLKTCMQTLRADRKAPCATTKLAMLNSAPAGTGAMVSATNVQTGQTYTATAAPLDTANPPAPQMLAVGQSLRLAWQADATFNACSIKATMPAGVLVSATTPSGSSLIGSGANWQLPETPPVIGPLTEPGIYDFSIYCRDTYTGSLQFQVGTTGPRSVVQLVTSVRGAVQATAVHSNSLMQPSTTTNVQSADSVELTWIAYNVLPGSCFLSGPGVTSNEEVGSQVITAPGPLDQTFTFQCTGANDGVTRSVSSTLHPVASACSYSIAPATASLPAAGGTGSVTVTAPLACAWAAGGNPGWITITSGGNGSGNGTIGYSVQANTGSSRTGTLIIAGQTFTVTQAAQASAPLSATLSASASPVAPPDSMSSLASLIITVSGGTAGQRTTANVAVYLNTNLAIVPDTALLMDASGATIAAGKTANAYTFLNVQLEQPGAGGTSVYTIKNMKANTASMPIPGTGSAQVTAMAAITGAIPFPLNNPIQTVALVSPNVAPPLPPSGLVATAGDGRVMLTWTASAGATGYNVKRGSVAAGPYATIASSTGVSFIDTSVVNGSAYSYVVTATSTAGESANSNVASAMPVQVGQGLTPIEIAYPTDRDGNWEVYFANGRNELNFSNNATRDDEPAWSPDGKKIAFVRTSSNGAHDIWVMDMGGANQLNLTRSPGADDRNWHPHWSPDGSKIAFFFFTGGTLEGNLYIMKADGTGAKQVTFASRAYKAFSWSPDSKEIAFTRPPRLVNGGTIWDIVVVNVQTLAERNLTNQGAVPQLQQGSVDHPAWSPDGSMIAFWATLPDFNSQKTAQIWVINPNGGTKRQITTRPAYARVGYPVWSPDGRQIAFWSTNDTDGDTDLFVMNPAGRGLTNITAGPWRYDTGPTWSPDGKKIAFFGRIQPQGQSQVDVYVVDATGGVVTKLTTRPASDGETLHGGPVWRPR